MKPNYYSILPANVRYDNTLRPNEKILYSEITALTQKNGECYAGNKYFAELYDVKENAIATWIKHLKEKKYIDIEYEYKENTKEILKRIIKIGGIQKDTTRYSNECLGGIQKGEDNNTSINNKKEIYKERKFKKPTIEEIKEYIDAKKLNINPYSFYEYFEVGNWKDSKGNQVKNWKQKLLTWDNYSNNKSKRTIPQWFNQEIQQSEGIEDKDFDKFIQEFRNQ